MPFDGMFLACVKKELQSELIGARIDRIYQPVKREISIALRQPGKNYRLLLSAHPQMTRVHLTAKEKKNPLVPPPFCMLLRKYWEGGRILEITQNDLERILAIKVQSIDSFGITITTELIGEFMGKHSNIILVKKEENGHRKILGSVIPIHPKINRVRTILPGETYVEPPPQEKFSLPTLEQGYSLFQKRFYEDQKLSLKKVLVSLLQGTGPLTAERILLQAELTPENLVEETSASQFASLWEGLLKLAVILKEEKWSPVLIEDAKGEKKADYCALLLTEKKEKDFSIKAFNSPSKLLDHYYFLLETEEQLKELRRYLTQIITKKLVRNKKKSARLQKELDQAKRADAYKVQGELLNASLHKFGKGESFVILPNYYHPQGEEIKITLNPSLTPSQNAQHYFKKYKKALKARKEVTQRLKDTGREIIYLENILLSLGKAGQAELEEIQTELQEEGYVKYNKDKKGSGSQPSEPLKFISSDGIPISVGKNNRQNDLLTFKKAGKDTFWFHVKDFAGSHVIVFSANPPSKTIQEASLLAAYYSRGKNSSNVPVDYTKIKNVRKPKGAKPGMVIYDNHRTLYVTPSKERLPSPLKTAKRF